MDEAMRKGNQGEEFEHYRVLLFSIAYRMTGSASDAEDLVQETYLRYQASASQEIVSLKAYLTTIITRLALDYLKSARVAREQYIGAWLPEPILTSEDGAFPLADLEQQEALSLAFLRLLEALSPPERAVFLLHEVKPGQLPPDLSSGQAGFAGQARAFRAGATAPAPASVQFSFRQSGRGHGGSDQPSGSGCRLLVGWWRQSAVESQAYPRPASRGAFLVFLAERGAQKSAASDLYAGRDKRQPGHLVLGRGQPGRSHQPDPERRGHSGDLCSAEP